MSQAGNASQVPITVNKGVTGALFGLAIIAFIIRSYIRIRINKNVHAEDFILLFAVVCLCGVTGVAYTTMTAQYALLQLVLHGFEDGLDFRLLGEIPSISKEEDAASNIWWLVIFAVKMAFLLFFRRLISRLRSLNVWWWFVTTLTISAGLVSIAASWLTCPYFTVDRLLLSCQGTSAQHRTVRDTAITTTMDIMSDILILSLPVTLLWRVRISLRQKIGLAFSLCLSGVMIIVTIVRVAGMKQGGSGSVDIVWLAFWQQQECSIAVLMVSVSAFRSLFVQSSIQPPVLRHPRSSPSERRRKFLRRRPDPDLYDTHETNGLPQIPSATLTGIATVIGTNRRAEEAPYPDQQYHSHLEPSDQACSSETATSNSSARDVEHGHSNELILPRRNAETSDTAQRSSGLPWWKAILQPETARPTSTFRTGYWEVMSLFRTGHSESVVQSNDRSKAEL